MCPLRSRGCLTLQDTSLYRAILNLKQDCSTRDTARQWLGEKKRVSVWRASLRDKTQSSTGGRKGPLMVQRYLTITELKMEDPVSVDGNEHMRAEADG